MKSSAKKSLQSTGPMLPGMETCERSASTTYNRLTSLPEACHVSPTALQGSEKQALTNETSGLNFTGLFASLDQRGYWLRTLWGSLARKAVVSSVVFSGTWPKHGMMQNGFVYGRPTLARHTNENASLSWRTPQAADWKSSRIQAGQTTNLTHQVLWPTPTAIDSGSGRINKSDSPNAKERPTLAMMARKGLWPTPTARDWKSGTGARIREGHAPPLTNVVQGNLNPSWVECLMGFPVGWTDIDGQQDQESNNMSGNHHEPLLSEYPTEESD
jgi:hypothetical protein